MLCAAVLNEEMEIKKKKKSYDEWAALKPAWPGTGCPFSVNSFLTLTKRLMN